MYKNITLNKAEAEKILRNSLSDVCFEFIEILAKDNYECFAVGGCVRDCLLGITPKDEDLTTNATPEEVRKAFTSRGYSVWDSGLKHGTVTVVKDNTSIEITTYRKDGVYSDGRRPDNVMYVKDVKEDLKRRDLTINAMAYNEESGLVDIFGGLDDLQKGIIRAVGDANERILEDSLRMMRAVRFSAKYGFEIEESLIKAIEDNADSLSNVSRERVRDELCKTLMTDNPIYVRKFHELGLMRNISPEIDNLFYCEQNSPYHIYNVGDHTINALGNSPKDLKVRMALLLHDTGKPMVKAVNSKGFDSFHHHAEYSEIIAENVLRDLRFSVEEIRDICNLVKHHDFLLGIQDNSVKIHNRLRDIILDNSEVIEDILRINEKGTVFSPILEVARADNSAQNPENEIVSNQFSIYDKVETELNKILDGPHKMGDLALNGNDIMKIEKEDKNGKTHKCEGPAIKEMQKILLREIIDNPEANTKESLTIICGQNIKRAIADSERKIEEKRENSTKERQDKKNKINEVSDYKASIEKGYTKTKETEIEL